MHGLSRFSFGVHAMLMQSWCAGQNSFSHRWQHRRHNFVQFFYFDKVEGSGSWLLLYEPRTYASRVFTGSSFQQGFRILVWHSWVLTSFWAKSHTVWHSQLYPVVSQPGWWFFFVKVVPTESSKVQEWGNNYFHLLGLCNTHKWLQALPN